jgi:hypothetical protein
MVSPLPLSLLAGLDIRCRHYPRYPRYSALLMSSLRLVLYLWLLLLLLSPSSLLPLFSLLTSYRSYYTSGYCDYHCCHSSIPAAIAVIDVLAARAIIAVLTAIAAPSPTRIRSNRRIETVWLSSRCSGCAASRSAKTSKEHQNFTPQSSISHISATKAVISILRTAFDLQPNSLQDSFLQFTFHARGSVAQCCATMGTGVRATSKLHPPIFYPTYLSNESGYIDSENGVGFAAKFFTRWYPSVHLSSAWERVAMLRNYGHWCSRNDGDWCSRTWGASRGPWEVSVDSLINITTINLTLTPSTTQAALMQITLNVQLGALIHILEFGVDRFTGT